MKTTWVCQKCGVRVDLYVPVLVPPRCEHWGRSALPPAVMQQQASEQPT